MDDINYTNEFKYCITQLDSLDRDSLIKYSTNLLQMLDALTDSIDECSPQRTVRNIMERYTKLICVTND